MKGKRGPARSLLALLLLAAGALPAACGGERGGTAEPKGNHASLRLISEQGVLVPGTETVLGVEFSIDPGWHVYWNGQNDTGYPIRVEPRFPPGFTAGDLAWPAPERHVSPGGILDHVFHDRVTLLLPIRVPESARPGDRIRLPVKASWMVCRAECLPEEGEAVITLPVAASRSEGRPDSLASVRMGEARRGLPRLPEPGRLEAAWEGGALRLGVPGAAGLAFFPDTSSVFLTDLLASGEAEGESLRLTPKPGSAGRPVAGVLAVTESSGAEPVYFTVRIPLPEPD